MSVEWQVVKVERGVAGGAKWRVTTRDGRSQLVDPIPLSHVQVQIAGHMTAFFTATRFEGAWMLRDIVPKEAWR